MAARFTSGDPVQTPYGKGVVREVRNHGQLLVQIQQRTLVVAAAGVALLGVSRRPAAAPPADAPPVSGGARRQVDLHGLTVDEALPSIDAALDAALGAGDAGIVFIHGRSGGRLRLALHGRLRAISAVRSFRLDPRNPGATIVSFR